jgi:hypothetical protein
MMTKAEKQNILKSIAWDYDVQGDSLLDVFIGLREKAGPFDQDKLLLRVLERLPWHDVLELTGKDLLKQLLTPERIAGLCFPEQRRRYDRIRKILQGEPVSFSGWDPRHREAYRRSLLSNRWYRTQQTL